MRLYFPSERAGREAPRKLYYPLSHESNVKIRTGAQSRSISKDTQPLVSALQANIRGHGGHAQHEGAATESGNVHS